MRFDDYHDTHALAPAVRNETTVLLHRQTGSKLFCRQKALGYFLHSWLTQWHINRIIIVRKINMLIDIIRILKGVTGPIDQPM